MGFLSGLKNIELYRNLRLLRNLNKAARLAVSGSKGEGKAGEILETLIVAPQILLSVDSNFSCRPTSPPDPDHPWNVFFHFKVKIVNTGGEATFLKKGGLKVEGHGEILEPKVYDNEGGAFTYMKGGKYQSPIPPESEQIIPLNFILPSIKEELSTIKTSLHLEFENCRTRVLRRTVSRHSV